MSLLTYDEYVVTGYDVVQGFIFGIKTIIKMHNSFLSLLVAETTISRYKKGNVLISCLYET